MSLQFIIGDGQADHQKEMIRIASEWLTQPQQEVFFLVPNYNKFEREQEILSALKKQKGQSEFTSIRGQVYSFNRLAWYFLQRTGQFGGTMISEVGSAMILRKVLESVAEELVIFRGEITKKGFIAQLLELYKEFQLGNIQLADVSLHLQLETSKARDFQAKMQEIQVIFSAYENELVLRQLQVEQPIPQLTNYLKESDKGNQQYLFIVSGFANFSAQELALLQVLMQKSHLCVDLYLDSPAGNLEVFDLFFEAKQTYHQLKNLATASQVPVMFDKKAQPLTPISKGYIAIEELWKNNGKQHLSQAMTEHLEIWKAQTPEEELRQIAVEIRRLVADSMASDCPLRYRDIQLLTLNPEIYYSLIPIVFDELAIPYYLDEDRKMERHPLVEFIQALFALNKYHYRLSDIFRFLRTELYIPQEYKVEENWEMAQNHFRKMIDVTENKALAHQFQGNDWLQEKDWRLIEYNFEESHLEDSLSVEEQTNQVRRAFRRDIVPFFKELRQVKSTQEALTLFYQFLVNLGIEAQLICWRDQEVERGNLEEARNHEQTWAALMNLLDEFSDIYGEDTFDFELFEEILTTGLENVTFGKIPTAIDQVKINPLDLARPLQAKVTFAIGLNETVFPRKVENKTLLSSEEREQLNQLLNENQFLGDRVGEVLRNEPFVAYNVFLSARDKLYLTYAANYDTQQNIKISPYLQRLLNWSDVVLQSRQSLTLTSQPAHYVGSLRSVIRQLNTLHRQALDEKQPLPTTWRWLEKQVRSSNCRQLADNVFASQTYLNTPVSLPKETAIALYGQDIYSSISRMEMFYQCEYKYFASYGLRLKEREIYGLNPAITGEFFHDSLDQFLTLIIEKNISLTTLTEEQRTAFVEQVLQKIFGEIRYDLLNRSARMNFIRYQLSQTIQRVTWALKRQGEKTQLTPIQTEVLFGQIAGKKGIPGLELPLDSGGKIHLRGKIDRIDTAIIDGQPWISVIDYKSSSREFDLTEAYYGLAMQLVTYLDVALTDAVKWVGQTDDTKIAGAYYLHVHNPVLDSQKANEEERLKQYKYDGLFVDDATLFPVYDHSLEQAQHSSVFPIRKDKNEQLQKIAQSKGKFYTEEEIQFLMSHNRKKMQEGGNRILSGDIALNPSYKLKDKKRACQYCPFRSICTFDVMLQENNYHRIENLPKEEIIQRMREEENE